MGATHFHLSNRVRSRLVPHHAEHPGTYRHDGIGQPETGNVLISMPMLLSANPIGSIADHMAMHVSAVARTYNTEVRLPPPTKAR